MQRLPLAFFSAAALCALGGMIWGIVMAASNDHTMMPAHAHLNLLGWATLALMGTFYALTGKGGRMGWLNFWISFGAVVLTIPALAMVLAGKVSVEPLAIVGSLLALTGLVVFLINVLSQWRVPAGA